MPKQMRRLGGPWEELTEPRHMHPKACVRVQISSFCLDMSCHSFSRWSAGLLDCEVYVDCCLGGVVRSPEDSSKNQRSTAKQIIRQATFFYFFFPADGETKQQYFKPGMPLLLWDPKDAPASVGLRKQLS